MIKEDLKATARLSHLALSEDELNAALPSFEQMLEYFAAMQAADTERKLQGADLVHPSLKKYAVSSAHFRADTENYNNNKNNPDNNAPDSSLNGNTDTLLSSAEERDGRFILVPNVL